MFPGSVPANAQLKNFDYFNLARDENQIDEIPSSDIISISNGNLISTLPSWGPSFKIKFSIKVNSFDNGLGPNNPYSDVLHFTSTEKTCCSFA